MADDELTPVAPTITGPNDRALRTRAALRSLVCPGAGFALLGRGAMAVVTLLASLGTLGATAWLALQPNAAALWTVLGGLVLATALWVTEQLAVKRLTLRVPKPGFLIASAVTWLAVASVLVLLFTHFGYLRMVGIGMSPTLGIGERFFYHKRVESERLRRGVVVVYKLSDRSAWGKPGMLVVSRILAVPRDQLSIRDGRYLINGEGGPAVAVTGEYMPVIQVPLAPDTVTVPDNYYFVVQDSPQDGFDSRVLSWVEAKDIVGTRLYYVSGRGILKPVE
jgi:signal peptidase I